MNDSFSLSALPKHDIAEIREMIPNASVLGLSRTLIVPVDLYWRKLFFGMSTDVDHQTYTFAGVINFYRNAELVVSDSFQFDNDGANSANLKNRYGCRPDTVNTIFSGNDRITVAGPNATSPRLNLFPYCFVSAITSVSVTISSFVDPGAQSFFFMRMESQNVWN